MISPSELLRALIRFDTTNPPGNERACITFIADTLNSIGMESTLIGKDNNRPNLIARLRGRGEAPPLLLQGHIDVVTTANQAWSVDPFAAEIKDGFIWGRGAVDMKSGVSMMISAIMRTFVANEQPAGDIILLILSDEEAGGDFGARFLVEEHPEQFAGVAYSLGEFGGFSLHLAGTQFYPIQIAEKQTSTWEIVIRGPAGHGSLPIRNGAMAKAGRILDQIDRHPLPIHIIPPTKMMIGGIAEKVSFPANYLLRGLLNPTMTDRILGIAADRLGMLAPLLRHTISPTIISGGEKINVIPSEIRIKLDGRILPGFTADDLRPEIEALIRRAVKDTDSVSLELIGFDHYPADINMGLYPLLAEVLKQADPNGTPVPYLLPAVSDARYFAQLGIQNYGFTPMKLPADFNFSRTVHAADERIPVDAVDFGTAAIQQVIQKYR